MLQNMDLNVVSANIFCDVITHYKVNKSDNKDENVLMVANYDCYYGNINFCNKWLSKISDTVFVRKVSNDLSPVKLNI